MFLRNAKGKAKQVITFLLKKKTRGSKLLKPISKFPNFQISKSPFLHFPFSSLCSITSCSSSPSRTHKNLQSILPPFHYFDSSQSALLSPFESSFWIPRMHLYNAWLPPPVALDTHKEKESFALVVNSLNDSYRPDDLDSVYSTLKWVSVIDLSVFPLFLDSDSPLNFFCFSITVYFLFFPLLLL